MKNQRNRYRYPVGLIRALVALISWIALFTASASVAALAKQSDSDSISSASGHEGLLSFNRWSSNGPDGGPVLALAIDRSNPATMYAGTPTGVFKSTNGGGSWSSSLTNAYVQIVAIASTTPTTLYAAGRSGVYKSTDSGTSWNAVNNGLESQDGHFYATALALDPANSDIVYTAGPDIDDSSGTYKAIYRSTDGGGSWSVIKHSISPYAIHQALAIDPTNTNIIYAAGAIGAAGTVWKSTDNGRFWTLFDVGFDSRYIVRALAIDPTNPNLIYVGTEGIGVYKSSDGGGSWSAFNDGLQVDPSDASYVWGVSALAIDPGNPNIVFAGATFGGVFRSSNGGRWSAFNVGLSNLGVNALGLDPINTSNLYTGTGVGVFKSTSGGANWSAANKGLRGLNATALAVNPRNGNAIYTETDSEFGKSVYKSVDNGGGWSPGDFYPLAFDPGNANTIYARAGGNDQLSKSTDGGATWSLANNGLGDNYVAALAIDPGNPDTVYAATSYGGLFKSTNAAGSWSALSDQFYPVSITIDPGNSQTLYAVSEYDDCYSVTFTIYKSTDGGVTWKAGADFSAFSALAIDPIDTPTLYVSACGAEGCGIYESTDGGGTWNLVGAGLPGNESFSAVVIDPVHPNVIYTGTYSHGVFKSSDGGANWNSLNDGLTNLNINALATDASGSFLHAGTSTGVFDIQLSIPPQANQIDEAQFFVRQHYLDFLNREPDAGGLAYWTDRITQCGSDVRCISERRIAVSAAFFVEMEFQETGYYVDRFYKASFGRQPNYAEFTSDRGKVIGGSNLEANKQAFADEWVQRQAFRDAYPITLSNTEVVNKLFDSAGLTASTYDPQRQQEILAMNAGRSRALVLRDVIEIPDFKNIPDPNDPRYSELKQTSQYNPAFVLMQYFGYLRRDLDQSGYDFWLDVVNNREPNNYHGMVCSFLTSSEYQLRFGSTVTRSNADCGR